MTELPKGWTWAALGDLGQWMGGGTPSKSVASYWNGEIPWVSPKDMKVGRIVETEDHISETAIERSATNLLPPGAVLVVTRSGILRHTLPVAVAERAVALNQDLKALIPGHGVDPAYVAWSLRWSADRILRECSKAGTTVSNIETSRLLAFEIPLAPLSEQRRIVAAIEEHVSRVEAAEQSLEQAKRRAALLRTSTRSQAVSGDWPVVALGHVTESQIYGSSAKASTDPGGVPILRMGNIRDGALDCGELKYLPADHPDIEKCRLQPGDLLFNRTNSPELVGKSAVFKTGPDPTVFASYLIRVRLGPECEPDWAALAINSHLGRRYVASVRTQQVGQANVNGTKLAAMPIPLPPLEEQRRILAMVEHQFSVLDATDAQIYRALRRSAALRRSILYKAFGGELVAHDPSDEPASSLLERIANQRAAAPKRAQKATEKALA